MKNFDAWFSKFKNSISGYAYYVDFNKVYDNINGIKVELNILNSLIGSSNIEYEFCELIKKYPEVIKCIPILLAVRRDKIFILDKNREFIYNFKDKNYNVYDYCVFMRRMGLFDLISNKFINNIVDYVTGVEVGLDSNGRKNRGGHLMEDLVEAYLLESGLNKNTDYFKEMCVKDIEEKFSIDLSHISNKGRLVKRFDFVVYYKSNIYAIETNFYSSSGSKLNETSRSYKNIAIESRGIDKFSFVWITDGLGWKHAKNNLEETFDNMKYIYNINDLENGAIGNLINPIS